MNVWRPPPIFLCRTDACEWLGPTNTLAHFQANERIFGEMPVEREKFLAIAGFMPQDHERSVIQRSGIIRDDVDHAIHRRAERRAWLNKKVHAEVNCAPLLRRFAARAEQWRRVKQPRLIVTAHTNGCASAFHALKYFFRYCCSFRRAGICSKERTAHAQLKNEARNRSHINIQNPGPR